MGLLNWATREKVSKDAETSLQRMRNAIKNGGNSDEVFRELMKPNNFYTCIGGLANAATNIFPIMLDNWSNKEITKAKQKPYWDVFVREQEDCDEFFFGWSDMRIYVMAKAWKNVSETISWTQINAVFDMLDGLDIQSYRKVGWMRVALFYHLAQQGLEEKTAFQAAWNDISEEECKRIVKALTDEEILEYRLMG